MFSVKKLLTTSILIAAAACASAPVQHARVASAPTHLVSSFQNLSRIEITQNLILTQSSLAPAAITQTAGAGRVDPLLKRHEMDVHHTRRSKITSNRTLSERVGEPVLSKVSTTLPDGWASADETVYHLASGMRCPDSVNFPQEARDYALKEVTNFDAKSQNAGCHYQSEDGVAITLYASYWPDMSLDDSVAGSVASILVRFDAGEELSVMTVTMEAGEDADPQTKTLFDGMEEPVAGGFDIGEVNGVRYKTSLWLVKTEGWHVKARATYPMDDETSELIAAILFASSHIDIRKKNLETPMVAAAEI